MPHVAQIFRFPVKGLSAEPVDRVELVAGGTLPFDRAFAVENGPSGFDPAAPKHLPKTAFLMLMRNERLAALQTRFDDASSTLTITNGDGSVVTGRLDTAEGRSAIEAFFDAYAASDLRGPAKVVAAAGFSFSDGHRNVVSLINLETVRAIGRRIGAEVDPLRFRGNLLVDGLPAWEEFGWVGARISAGGVTFAVVERINRCAATNVDPVTGARDLTIPRSLLETYGHADCGVYLEVVSGGELSVGDAILPGQTGA
jgi:uncharacterized protein